MKKKKQKSAEEILFPKDPSAKVKSTNENLHRMFEDFDWVYCAKCDHPGPKFVHLEVKQGDPNGNIINLTHFKDKPGLEPVYFKIDNMRSEYRLDYGYEIDIVLQCTDDECGIKFLLRFACDRGGVVVTKNEVLNS